MPHWCCRAANPPSSLGCESSSDSQKKMACQCNTRYNSKGVCHVKGKWMSWASRAVPLSPPISVIYVPLDPTLLLSSLFFSPSSKSLQPRVLLWHSQPHLEPEAIQELLLRLAVDAEGARCCGSHSQVPPGSPAGKVCSSGASAHALGKRTSQEAVTSMSPCSLRAEGDEIARPWWSCTFPTEWKRQAKCTPWLSFFHLVLGMLKGFQSPAASHRAVHASCSEWGFNANKTPQSLVGIVDFIGQRLKRVEFHPPHLCEIKGISWRALQAGTAGKSHRLFVLQKGFHIVTVMKLFGLSKLCRGREVGFKVSESEEKSYQRGERKNWGKSEGITGWRRLGKRVWCF